MPTFEKPEWHLEGAGFMLFEFKLSAAVRCCTTNLVLGLLRIDLHPGWKDDPGAALRAGHARTRNAIGHI